MGKQLSKSKHHGKAKTIHRLSSIPENEDYGFVSQNTYGNPNYYQIWPEQRVYANQAPLRRYASTSNISTTPTTSDYGSERGRNNSPRYEAERALHIERTPSYNFETDARPIMRRSQSWLHVPSIYQMKEEFYDMNHKRRGDCIIINIKHVGGEEIRAGTEHDVDKLKESFSYLGFEVHEKSDLNKEEIIAEMKSIAGRNHSDDDCFVCIILSHGKEGQLYTTDGEVPLGVILDPVKNCQSLLGKPKLFFIQTCGGSRIDYGSLVNDGSSSGEDNLRKLSKESDVLIAYATTPDYVSWRDTRKGSIYIEVLCELLKQEGIKTKITELLQKVSNYTTKYFAASRFCQVPCYTSSLSKSLVFSLKKRVVMVIYNDGTYANVSQPDAYASS